MSTGPVSLNPESLTTVDAQVPQWLLDEPAGSRVQFERLGYFVVDVDHQADAPLFNRTATLRDSFAKKKK